ncbi:MAG TPA: hypothetical protein EYN28_06460 [Flavobacteriales bacterium]|nr:hypothetical protein [Flavobacteriales bacterium]HIN41903.1 hypothetical protein [Flavobacteriales bacterium]HIO15219.1 hypothetical protein [Flavobacteriales bacterium]HIO59801.1 hypothetical protein [Flavobacteriales bacterium]
MSSLNTHIRSTNDVKNTTITAVCIVFIMFLAPNLYSQLQVLNGGFEFSKTVPNESGQWELINSWTNAGSEIANPDYYHTFGYNGGDLPETPLAYIQAYNGYAIAGLEVSRRSGTNMREYLMGEFSEALVVGKRYEFSFAVANGDVYDHSAAGLGVSDLGVAFSTEELVQTDRDPIATHPQFSMTHVQYYHGWKVIKFAFTADKKFKFFTFGMFGSDIDKQIQSFEGPGRSKAYYFVDDFSIRDLTSELQTNNFPYRGDSSDLFSLESSTFVPTAFSPNSDGLNDVFMPSLGSNRGALLRVFDRSGAMIWESAEEQPNWSGITMAGGDARPGVYLWTLKVIVEDGSVEELSGPVTLLQ